MVRMDEDKILSMSVGMGEGGMERWAGCIYTWGREQCVSVSERVGE